MLESKFSPKSCNSDLKENISPNKFEEELTTLAQLIEQKVSIGVFKATIRGQNEVIDKILKRVVKRESSGMKKTKKVNP